MKPYNYTFGGLYTLCGLISYVLISGMVFAVFEGHLSMRYTVNVGINYRVRCRVNLGTSLVVGGAAAIWPIALPVTFALTGFAPDGVWTQYPPWHCGTIPAGVF